MLTITVPMFHSPIIIAIMVFLAAFIAYRVIARLVNYIPVVGG